MGQSSLCVGSRGGDGSVRALALRWQGQRGAVTRAVATITTLMDLLPSRQVAGDGERQRPHYSRALHIDQGGGLHSD